MWGPCRLEDSGDLVPPHEIKPCSSILDVGDSATAVAFCPVLCSDNRYTHLHPCLFGFLYYGKLMSKYHLMANQDNMSFRVVKDHHLFTHHLIGYSVQMLFCHLK